MDADRHGTANSFRGLTASELIALVAMVHRQRNLSAKPSPWLKFLINAAVQRASSHASR